MFDIPAAVTAVSGVISTVLNRVLPREKMSEADAAKIELAIQSELLKADWQAISGQLAINQQEAAHASVFVAGWRPFIGWVCGSALAYNFVLQPLLVFVVTVGAWQAPPIPTLDVGELSIVLMGMLGLGGMRSFEKVRGAAPRVG